MLTRLLPSSTEPIRRSLSSVILSARSAPFDPLSICGAQLAPRGGGERGLGAREERRKHQQSQDRKRRDPEGRVQGGEVHECVVLLLSGFMVVLCRSIKRLNRRDVCECGHSGGPVGCHSAGPLVPWSFAKDQSPAGSDADLCRRGMVRPMAEDERFLSGNFPVITCRSVLPRLVSGHRVVVQHQVAQPLFEHMGVDLGRGDIRMTQKASGSPAGRRRWPADGSRRRGAACAA